MLDHSPLVPSAHVHTGGLAWRATHVVHAGGCAAAVLIMVVRFAVDWGGVVAAGCTREEFRGRRTWRGPYQVAARVTAGHLTFVDHNLFAPGPSTVAPFARDAGACGEAAAEIVFDEAASVAGLGVRVPASWDNADVSAFLRSVADVPSFPREAMGDIATLTPDAPAEWFNVFLVAARERYAAMHEAASAARSRR